MFTDFLKQYGTLLIAIYGVIQIWLIAIWKNYIHKGKIIIFKSGKLEVGFSNFGPTLAINGTLGAEHKDVFVSDIRMEIKRCKDNSTHKFNWTALRPNQLTLGASTPMTFEIPSAFIVKPDVPYRFHIFFSDRDAQNEIQPYLTNVITEWNNFILEKQEAILQLMKDYTVSRDLIHEHLYDNEFTKSSKTFNDAWDVMNRNNYWEPGDYEIDLIVNSHNPSTEFKDSFKFKISQGEFESLRLNSIATLRELCTGKVNYFFEFVKFE